MNLQLVSKLFEAELIKFLETKINETQVEKKVEAGRFIIHPPNK